MRFIYKTIDASGLSQSGEISAANEQQALAQIRGQVIEIKAIVEKSGEANSGFAFNQSIKNSDLLSLIQELSTLIAAGVSLTTSLNTLYQATVHPGLKNALEIINKSVHDGGTLSDALIKANLNLPEYVYSLTRAGEATGDVGNTLKRAAKQMEFDETLRNQTREAMIYPVVLLLSGCAAVLFLFSFVVPRFSSIFKSKKVELPWISEFVLAAGVFFNQHWQTIIIALVVFFVLIYLALQSKATQQRLSKILAVMPVFAPWIRGTETARWTSSLAILLQSRVPILQAIELAASSLKVESNQRSLRQIAKEVRSGKTLSDAIDERKLLNGSLLTMLKVGEQVGEVGNMLGNIADNASTNQQRLQRRVVALMEPFSIIFIGSLVAFVMIGIVLAMTSLTDFKF